VGKEIDREIQRLFDLVPVAGTTAGLTSFDGIPPPPPEEKDNTALEPVEHVDSIMAAFWGLAAVVEHNKKAGSADFPESVQ